MHVPQVSQLTALCGSSVSGTVNKPLTTLLKFFKTIKCQYICPHRHYTAPVFLEKISVGWGNMLRNRGGGGGGRKLECVVSNSKWQVCKESHIISLGKHTVTAHQHIHCEVLGSEIVVVGH